MAERLEFGGQILILTGPPGAGKTTTASALAAIPGSSKVHLHSDDFWHFIKHGCIPPYLAEAHEQNSVVMHALAKVVRTFAEAGYFVILDGIVGPWFLQPFQSIEAPIHYVVLLPPPETAVRRCQGRGGSTLTDAGPIVDLHRQFSTLGGLDKHAMRIDGDNPTEVLAKVIGAIGSMEYLLERT